MSQQIKYKNLIIRENDQIFFTCVASERDDKDYLDDVYRYYLTDERRYLLKHEDVDDSNVPEGTRAQHLLSMWVYVYYVLHEERRNNSWAEIETEAKKKMFKEDINDYKIIDFGYGRRNPDDETYENYQKFLTAIEYNKGYKGIVKIRKTGVGLGTEYHITGEHSENKIPENRKREMLGLTPIMEHYLETYGGVKKDDSGIDLF